MVGYRIRLYSRNSNNRIAGESVWRRGRTALGHAEEAGRSPALSRNGRFRFAFLVERDESDLLRSPDVYGLRG